MGCDIHAYLESYLGNEMYVNVARWHLPRNYMVFGLMAGVREPEHQLFVPRGVPQNMSFSAFDEYTVRASEECSRENIDYWVSIGVSVWIDEARGVASGPDWHGASWLNAGEMEQVQSAYEQIEVPRASWYQSDEALNPQFLAATVPDAQPTDVAIEPQRSDLFRVTVGPYRSAKMPAEWTALVAAMRELGDTARLVFWFDN